MIAKLLMFLVSYIPLYIFLMILKWEVPYGVFCGASPDVVTILFYLTLLLFFIISIGWLIFFRFIKNNNSLSFDDLNRPDDTVISYVFTYIVPILSVTSGGLEIFLVNLLLFFMVAILYVRMQLFYINPILTLFGYITYMSNQGFIVSNIPYNDLLRLKNNLPGCYLANGVFLAKRSYLQNNKIE